MTRREVYVTYKGRRQSLNQWAAEMDVSWLALYQRLVRRKWPVERAMETPFQKSVKPAKERVCLELTDGSESQGE